LRASGLSVLVKLCHRPCVAFRLGLDDADDLAVWLAKSGKIKIWAGFTWCFTGAQVANSGASGTSTWRRGGLPISRHCFLPSNSRIVITYAPTPRCLNDVATMR